MKNYKSWVIASVAVAALLVVGIFVYQFHASGISADPSDWYTFASYFNGMLTPLLTFVNILVLLGVGQAVYNLSKEDREHRNRLKTYNNCDLEDLKVQINPDATAEDNLQELEQHLARIEELFSMFKQSDESCEKDLYELAERAGVSKRAVKSLHEVPYYENPFINRMWELHNIGATNVMTYAQTSLLQLRVNVYELMLKQDSSNAELHEKYMAAKKALEEFHKNSGLAD